jgi:hypothetical protein
MVSNPIISTEKVSVAALISVILRRKISRTIDIKWLVENEAYAKEIIELCREQGLVDLNEYADHLEKLMFGKVSITSTVRQTTPYISETDIRPTHAGFSKDLAVEDNDGLIDVNKYVGGLR